MIPPPTELLTKAELAERLKLTTRTIDSMIARGEMPCLKLSPRTVRFNWADVMAALGQRRVN
jgi:excisionase family DNA binding protein